jgi:glutamate-1-semialdehyde 2,1-aminomutase
MAAICGKREIMAVADVVESRVPSSEQVVMGGTFSGNPIGAVAGLATLRELAKAGTYDRLHGMGEQIRSGLQEILTRRSVAGQVAGVGPMFHILFTGEPVTSYRTASKSDIAMERKLRLGAFDRGVLLHPTRSFISTVHSEADVGRLLEVIDDVLESL